MLKFFDQKSEKALSGQNLQSLSKEQLTFSTEIPTIFPKTAHTYLLISCPVLAAPPLWNRESKNSNASRMGYRRRHSNDAWSFSVRTLRVQTISNTIAGLAYWDEQI